MLYLLAIFVIIVLIVIVLLVMPQHWFAEKKETQPVKHRPTKLPAPVAEEKFRHDLDKESAKLEKILQQKAALIDQEFTAKLNKINNKQLKDYEQALSATLQKTLKNLHEAASAATAANQGYKKSLEEELKKAKANVVEKVDSSAADIMISYLSEVAAEIDYQQQKDYLYKSLEANLPALQKDVQNGL
ncbi:hypothetical protein HYX70_03765 [Candidatus Saccharibacteria bacterium]|nr:hypothetical protein [Candidatus Saccharibacteria bacterium]